MGCGRRDGRGALVRLGIRDGELIVEPVGGRGAYLHPRESCVERARARGRLLGRSLRAPATIPDDFWQRIAASRPERHR